MTFHFKKAVVGVMVLMSAVGCRPQTAEVCVDGRIQVVEVRDCGDCLFSLPPPFRRLPDGLCELCGGNCSDASSGDGSFGDGGDAAADATEDATQDTTQSQDVGTDQSDVDGSVADADVDQ